MQYLNNLISFTDSRGSLVSIEGGVNIPFDIRRVFYIYGVPSGSKRGGHAHHNAKQFITCLNGGFNLEVIDRSGTIKYIMSNPTIGVYVPELSWTNLSDFLPSTIAVVFSDSFYDQSDYIKSYEVFSKIITA